MAPRHIALAVFAVLVTGMCVYLFLEVRASPAPPATRPAARDTKAPDDQESSVDDSATTTVATKPEGARGESAGLRGAARQAAVGEASGGATPVANPPTLEAPAGEDKLAGPKLDAIMAEANKAYDKMEFDEARTIAQKVLRQQPTNTRMLRIMTSSYCIENDAAESQKYFNQLPAPDREQMKTRCARYGVTFTEPPAK